MNTRRRTTRNSNAELYGVLIVILLWVVAAIGWIANIVKLVGIADEPISGMFIIRVVGIFVAPLGVVLGII